MAQLLGAPEVAAGFENLRVRRAGVGPTPRGPGGCGRFGEPTGIYNGGGLRT